MFCGAGGSSQGAVAAGHAFGGIELRLAMNHWQMAIDTHNTNFPNAEHHCSDISASDPRWYPSTTILIASPECTNHSIAKGKKAVQSQMRLFEKGILDPAADRSRATMWDVPRFAEFHRYEMIIIENVVDARRWVQFPAWIQAMDLLGYNYKIKYLNSMHFFPTPQSRDRMYVVFWKKGNKAPDLDHRPLAHCSLCGDVQATQVWKNREKPFGKYKTQYIFRCPTCHEQVEPYYYAAFNCIDWTDPGIRIGDRKKPLVTNTMRRIQYGLDKYGADPFQILNYSPGYTKAITEATGAVTTTDHHAIAMPFIFKGEHTTKQGYARSAAEPLYTQTNRQSMGLVVPWIIEMNRTGKAKPATHPTGTFTAGGINHAMMITPLIVNNKGASMSRPGTDPTHSVTTKPHLGIITDEAFNSFIASHYKSPTTNHISDAIGTCTTKERHALVSFKTPEIEDCFYRMLRAREIQKAMAFDDNYTVLGNEKDQVRQLGNAVTPPVMKWLTTQCLLALND